MVLCSVSIFILSFLSVIIKKTSDKSKDLFNPASYFAVLALWFLLALLVAIYKPLSVYSVGLVVLPIATAVWLSNIQSFKNILSHVSPHWLIYIQVYRIAGFLFLYLFYNTGMLSKGFAINAGWGDVITGIMAIPVGYWVQNKKKGWSTFAVLWNFFGIVDLIVAPLSAVAYGAKGLNEFPLIMIPLFLGPPLGTFIHICSLKNIQLTKISYKS
jgi:hypothetical protein